jgi:hypothetical protein
MADREKLKRTLWGVGSLTLMSVSLFLLFRRVDPNEVRAGWEKIWSSGGLTALVFWTLVYATLQGLRFAMVYPAGVSLRRHVELNFANHSGNILLPARLGEAIRPFYLKLWKPELPLKAIIGWTLWEKLGEFLSMVLFLAVTALLYRQGLIGNTPSWPLTLSCSAIVLLALLLPQLLWRMSRGQHLPSRGPGMAWALGLSFATWVANLLGLLAVTGNPMMSFGLLLTMSIAGAIPLFPGGLGAAQWAFVLLNDFAHLASDGEALAYSASIHLIWLLVRLLVGVPLLLSWGWPERLDAVKNAMRNEVD